MGWVICNRSTVGVGVGVYVCVGVIVGVCFAVGVGVITEVGVGVCIASSLAHPLVKIVSVNNSIKVNAKVPLFI
jgi:hypothetical protein